MKKYFFKLLGLLSFSLMLLSTAAFANDDDFLILFIPALVSSLNCDANNFSGCKTNIGCNKINGNWGNRICTQKTTNQLKTEELVGKWSVVTTFDNGDFFNYLYFDKGRVVRISGSADYLIKGHSHSSPYYSDSTPINVVGSYDSINSDWFILDYWGLDLETPTISSIEVNQVSSNRFTGCEYLLDYPDFTYQDGVCNPVSMSGTSRNLAKGSSLTSRRKTLQRSNDKTSIVDKPSRTPGSAYRSNARRLNLANTATEAL